ncbi:putative F-box protein At2g02030 isoform X2 [Asparagus officinalis]|uniref:putative F-box protein At2g02030 isoform X2 n=1 Tax=Asparagus officinalis TaxID=4686 RepID=UPI00098E3F9B|nr:putative F-box protein At2g02030 isoform X2 [Asparagus officinalis]
MESFISVKEQYFHHVCYRGCLIPMKRVRKNITGGQQIEMKKRNVQQNHCSKLKLYFYRLLLHYSIWMEKTDRRRRIKKIKSNPILSEDIISSEILPRLPAKDVLRWRSVSKSWNAVIPNPFLARLHLVRARKRLPKLMFITIDGLRRGMSLYAYDLSSSSKRHGASLLFNHLLCKTERSLFRPQHCNGLVLLSFATGPFFVCKPATQELVILPKRHSLSFCFVENFGAGFSFIPSK